MEMADDVRKNIDSAITQGTRQVKSTLPQLPFPGGEASDFAKGPQDILAKIPKLPMLPELPGTKTAAPAAKVPTSKFLAGGPMVEVTNEWHDSHTLSPRELEALKSPLQKDSVPTPSAPAIVLRK
jgi:hypothetical protein